MLDNERMPVPEYFYMVVEQAVYIVMNFPSINETKSQEVIVKYYKWRISKLEKLFKKQDLLSCDTLNIMPSGIGLEAGYLFCCKYSDFKTENERILLTS